MQQADFQRFKEIMAGIGRLFSADTDGVVLDAYWMALGDWQLPDFERAAGHLMATCQFMPKPADFTALRKAAGPSSAEAWTRVLAAIRDYNPYVATSIDERTDRVVRALGGYQMLAMSESSSMQFREKRFAELWEDSTTVDESRAALPAPDSAPRLVRDLAATKRLKA
jgi:hypothetical protein